jgi:hypothetical protein
MFHNLVQAAGRGRCRHTVDGKAPPMTLSVMCNVEFAAHWYETAMPDAKVLPWGSGAPVAVKMKHDERVAALEEALRTVPERVASVSTYTMRKLAGLTAVEPDVFARLLKKVSVPGWNKQGRSFVRTSPFTVDI